MTVCPFDFPCVFRGRLSIIFVRLLSFRFEGGMWYLILLVPYHCFFYLMNFESTLITL